MHADERKMRNQETALEESIDGIHRSFVQSKTHTTREKLSTQDFVMSYVAENQTLTEEPKEIDKE